MTRNPRECGRKPGTPPHPRRIPPRSASNVLSIPFSSRSWTWLERLNECKKQSGGERGKWAAGSGCDGGNETAGHPAGARPLVQLPAPPLLLHYLVLPGCCAL